MKKILVPTDFSVEAKNALNLAIQLAEKEYSEIYLLHIADIPVVSDPVGANIHAYLSNDAMTSLMENVHTKLDDFSRFYSGEVKIHLNMEWGSPYSGIIKSIEELDCDFVVMGSKGASGLKELIIGSNAEKIIRNSPVPVIRLRKKLTW